MKYVKPTLLTKGTEQPLKSSTGSSEKFDAQNMETDRQCESVFYVFILILLLFCKLQMNSSW